MPDTCPHCHRAGCDGCDLCCCAHPDHSARWATTVAGGYPPGCPKLPGCPVRG